jgi:hypothetical protein
VWAKRFVETVDESHFSEAEGDLFQFLCAAIDDFEAEMPVLPDGAFYTTEIEREARRKAFELIQGARRT